MSQRVVAWFSCGDASAVACKLALDKYRNTHEVVVCRILLDSEHPDNDRFCADWQEWAGWPITAIRSEKYRDSWEVWEKKRYIAGIKGAPCTTELKKVVRKDYQRPDDIHVFGFTAEERKRADTFRSNNFELFTYMPLLDANLGKADCHALIRGAGIELPMMYRLGFDNNNCIGCPKGGSGYWNMIRKHFPEQFQRMAVLSRSLGCRLIKEGKVRIFLDELKPDAGRQKDEVAISCSSFCHDIEDQFIPAVEAAE